MRTPYLYEVQSGQFIYEGTAPLEFYESDTVPCPDIHGVGRRAAYYLRDARNVTLDFGGAVILFHGKIQPFFLENCENVKIMNCAVKYDRSPFTEGVITDRGRDFLKVKLNPEHTCRVEDGKLIPYGECWENRNLNSYIMFLLANDGRTRRGIGGALGVIGDDPQLDKNLPYSKGALTLSVREENGELVFTDESIPDFYHVGDYFTISHEERTVSSLAAVDCKDTCVENFRIINGIGMGLMPIHCENFTVNGLNMFYDGLSSGIYTNGADGIHSFACSGEFLIENCVMETMVDDAINVHSNFYALESAEECILRAVVKGPEDTGIKIFGEGDMIRICRGTTLETEGIYQIRSVRTVDRKTIEIMTDRPVGLHTAGDTINNLSTRCSLTVRNCRFANSAVSHIRIQNGRKALFENCETEFQLLLTGDMTYWYEADPVEELEIRNCRFTKEDARIFVIPEFTATEKEPFYHRKVTVTGCEFLNPVPVTASYLEALGVKGCCRNPAGDMTVILNSCGRAEAEGCTFERHVEALK